MTKIRLFRLLLLNLFILFLINRVTNSALVLNKKLTSNHSEVCFEKASDVQENFDFNHQLDALLESPLQINQATTLKNNQVVSRVGHRLWLLTKVPVFWAPGGRAYKSVCSFLLKQEAKPFYIFHRCLQI